MSYEFFIAKKLLSGKTGKMTSPVVRIAIAGIALGMAVMIVAVMVVTGFKNEITEKVIGFGSHIRIGNFDANYSYEEIPIKLDTVLINKLNSHPGISHVQMFATKAGIIKTENEIQGVVLKGINKDYDNKFFESKLISGRIITPGDSSSTNEVMISLKTAQQLSLNSGDDLVIYFIEQPPRVRKLKVVGVYDTGLDEFDKVYAFCDISLIRRLNNWSKNEAGGVELLIKDFSKLDYMNDEIYNLAGYQYYTQSIREQYPQIFHWLDLQNINVIIIITLILLVAGISMVSTLLIIILENTTLIGVLKALGAPDASVRKIFIYIALPVIGTGILAGNVIGLSLGAAQAWFGLVTLPQESYYVSEVPVHFSLAHLLLLNAGTIVACFLMLIGPSMVITRISPAKVIRYD